MSIGEQLEEERKRMRVLPIAVLLVLVLAGVGAYYALLPQDTIEIEQASEVEEQASEEEEETTEEEEEVAGVETVTVVYTEPEPEAPEW